MTEYTIADVSPGDRVTLEHDNTKYPVEAGAFIREGQTFLELKYASFSLSVPWMLARGWRITAVVKPEPELPTEPGHYVDKEGDPWQLKPEDDSHEARWFCGSEYMLIDIASKYAPFTRLAPVPEPYTPHELQIARDALSRAWRIDVSLGKRMVEATEAVLKAVVLLGWIPASAIAAHDREVAARAQAEIAKALDRLRVPEYCVTGDQKEAYRWALNRAHATARDYEKAGESHE